MNNNIIREVGALEVQNDRNHISRTAGTGSFGSAATFDFNPDSQTGLIIEAGSSESAGIYLDGDTAVIWSPGDEDVLRVYDEDSFSSGPIFTVRNNRTVEGVHTQVTSPANSSTLGSTGTVTCPSSRVANSITITTNFLGELTSVRLGCVYVK